MTASADRIHGVEWAVATRSLPGEAISGDLHLVVPFPGGVLVGAVDGLGHGKEAAAVARVAAETIRMHAQEPIANLFLLCHRALRGSRGAVMTLASFQEADRMLTWHGVGNVEGVILWREADGRTLRRGLVIQRGVVGCDLYPPRPGTHTLGPLTMLVLATDGIMLPLGEDLSPSEPVQDIADRILARYGRRSDDALALVVRYRMTER